MALGVLTVPSFTSNNHDSSLLLRRDSDPLLRLCSEADGRRLCPVRRAPASSLTTRASLSSTKESVLGDFRERRALKIISGLQNFDKDNVASVIIAANKRFYIKFSMESTTATGSTPPSSPPRNTVRGKSDPAWGHCIEASESGGKGKKLVCLYCQKTFKGGGINRFKQHLAGVKGDTEPCKKVSADVRFQMHQNIEELVAKKRKVKELYHEQSAYGPSDRDEQIYMQSQNDNETEIPHLPLSSKESTGTANKVDRGRKGNLSSYFMPRTTPGAQPSIRSVLQGKEAKEKCDLAISKWMIDTCIPFNVVNSVNYQPMIDAIAGFGPGYKGPGFHDLRGYLLNKNVEEVKSFVDSFRVTWKETGCTIMADGWTDQCRRTLINFLVYCPRGTIFLKSVDASDASKTAEMLYKLFREVVLYVGPENVVHMVTDNAANYVAAGRLLQNEFRTLSWSPCAAHCLNLMMQDIGKLDGVSEVVEHASKITKYVYNHCYALHLMRKHTGGREILRPAPTRFATNFIALQSILAQKDALRAMVTSREWTSCAYAKESKAKKFVDYVLDSSFWKECIVIVQLTEPLVRVLRIVDSDERPAMGYLYEAFHKAKDEMIKRFQRRKKRIEPYMRILETRWDNQLHKNLHAAGYWFNPSNQYNTIEMAKHRQTTSGILDVIEMYAYGNPTLRSSLTKEMRLFRNAEGDFGRVSAISDRNVMPPDEWWLCYGSSAPNLQKLAIRVLSQTCSASGCERNWSAFEHIHSKKRNRLEHQRLNDLVYVHYNLRLQQRNYLKRRKYDPIDFEDFTENGTWILEDEPPTLTIDEVESFRRDLEACSIQNPQIQNIDLNLDALDDDLDLDGDDGNNIENIVEDGAANDPYEGVTETMERHTTNINLGLGFNSIEELLDPDWSAWRRRDL